MTITHHRELTQGSPEWLAARIGLLTASEMKHIITRSNLKPANNDKERAHVYEILAQRVTGYVEPHYIGDDMLRGMTDEVDAREIYADNYGDVQEVGFITNDKWGFTIGFSPDGLVGDEGLIECKSRRQKYQIETILGDAIPDDYLIQVQTGLLVSERKWCDFITYSAGLPMMTLRVFPDVKIQAAILDAASIFEGKIAEKLKLYNEKLAAPEARLIPTERRVEEEITLLTLTSH